eukprot:scaffold114741_cov19-Tisochrysis_lutea.AAC.2
MSPDLCTAYLSVPHLCIPAGTGKTETVKELARCVAKQCIVFNTTEQLDVSHMTRLLMGIASTVSNVQWTHGSWP